MRFSTRLTVVPPLDRGTPVGSIVESGAMAAVPPRIVAPRRAPVAPLERHAPVVLWDGDRLTAPTKLTFWDDIDAEIAALSTPFVPDLSPVTPLHCGRRWDTETDGNTFPWICTRAPEHSGDHQALTRIDACMATLAVAVDPPGHTT